MGDHGRAVVIELRLAPILSTSESVAVRPPSRVGDIGPGVTRSSAIGASWARNSGNTRRHAVDLGKLLQRHRTGYWQPMKMVLASRGCGAWWLGWPSVMTATYQVQVMVAPLLLN
jgi:hypothetical protein